MRNWPGLFFDGRQLVRASVDGEALRTYSRMTLMPFWQRKSGRRRGCRASLPSLMRDFRSCLKSRHFSAPQRMSASGRLCCRSLLQAFLVSDSVVVMRFAMGADHDGAAQSRPGTVFLFILP